MPRMFIISGCNGSGKTTASYSLLPEMLECSEFVNSDEFAKGFSPFKPESASILASRYMITKIRYLLARHKDFGVETTLATRTLLKTVRIAQSVGYTVTVLYFWLNSPELAIERVKARVAAGGHIYLRKRFEGDTMSGSHTSSMIMLLHVRGGFLQIIPRSLSG